MSNFCVSEDKQRAELKYAHLSFDDFDRSGNLSPWKIAKLFQNVRFMAMTKSNFLDVDKFIQNYTEGYTIFILLGTIDVDPLFYHVTRNVNVNVPVKVSLELIGTGRSALTMKSTIKHAEEDIVFAQLTFKYVFVDRKTRRSRAPPTWFFAKYSKEADPCTTSKLQISFPNMPFDSSCHRYSRTVAPSNTDFNQHLNNAEYIRYCMDAASHSCQKGHFRSMSGDVTEYTVTNMQFYYGRECRMDERLTVCVWESSIDARKLHFCILKNETVVFQANVQFKPTVRAKY